MEKIMSVELKLEKDTMIVSETDSKGFIKYVNEVFCSFSEYSKDEILGQPHNLIRHPDMPKAAFSTLWETIQKGQTWNGVVKNLSKNGNYYWVNATVFTSKDTNGNLRYISVRTKATQTEIKKAEKLYKTLV
jgi:aerotaxis receptor